MSAVCITQGIEVQVEVVYLAAHSSPQEDDYRFAYHVQLTNHSPLTVQLLRRHWIIIDGHERVRHVRGDGVVGEQPVLAPGEGYTYTSGSVMPTPMGTMEGSYAMQTEAGETIEVQIPRFVLEAAMVIH